MTAHPPAPPGPPPSAAAARRSRARARGRRRPRRLAPPPPPPPPPPPQLPDLIMTVGPGQTIGAYYADGRRATRVPPGEYTIQVHDLSTTHNFHLTGPGRRREDGGRRDRCIPIWRPDAPGRHLHVQVRRAPVDQGNARRLDHGPSGAEVQGASARRQDACPGSAADSRGPLLGGSHPPCAFEARSRPRRLAETESRARLRGYDEGEPRRQPRSWLTTKRVSLRSAAWIAGS